VEVLVRNAIGFDSTRGDRITVTTRVADVQERAGASGTMDILVLEDEGRDAQGALVFRTREVFVLRRG